MGLIFDDRGNLMAPVHTVKKGIRYRYYLSRAMLEGRKAEAGSVRRVSAPDIEHLVLQALRAKFEPNSDQSDKEMITQHVERVIIHSTNIELIVKEGSADDRSTSSMRIPFTPPSILRKGVVHTPAQQSLDPQKRDALIETIARSWRWVKRLTEEPDLTTDALARDEKIVERHLRFLLPLSYVSPKIIAAIIDGTAPSHITASTLARGLPYRWAEQERILS